MLAFRALIANLSASGEIHAQHKVFACIDLFHSVPFTRMKGAVDPTAPPEAAHHARLVDAFLAGLSLLIIYVAGREIMGLFIAVLLLLSVALRSLGPQTTKSQLASLVLTIVAIGCAFDHTLRVENLARWNCALAELSSTIDAIGTSAASYSHKSQLAFSGIILRLGTLDSFVTDLHDSMATDVTLVGSENARAKYYRKLWADADSAYIDDRLAQLKSIADDLVERLTRDRDLDAQIEMLGSRIQGIVSDASRTELLSRCNTLLRGLFIFDNVGKMTPLSILIISSSIAPRLSAGTGRCARVQPRSPHVSAKRHNGASQSPHRSSPLFLKS